MQSTENEKEDRNGGIMEKSEPYRGRNDGIMEWWNIAKYGK
jgi:hypothetical protein